MIDKNLMKDAVEGHQMFRHAVENDLPERFELGKRLEKTLDTIDGILNEEAEIVSVLPPINISSAELKSAKEATLKYAEAWKNWTRVVREDIQKNRS